MTKIARNIPEVQPAKAEPQKLAAKTALKADPAEAKKTMGNAALELAATGAAMANRLGAALGAQKLQTGDGGGSGATIGPITYTFSGGGKPTVQPGEGNAPGSARGEAEHILNVFNNPPDAQAISHTTAILNDHKNDPAFVRQFLNALGSDYVRDVLRGVTNPQSNTFDGAIDHQNQVWADALSTLAKDGTLSKTDFEAIIGPNINNPYVATDLISKGSNELKQMYIDLASSRALSETNPSKAADLAALSAHVMAQLPLSAQMDNLSRLQQSGKLDDFMKLAMQGEARLSNVPDLKWLASDGWGEEKRLNLSGVESLLGSVSLANSDRNHRVALSGDAVRSLRVEMFNAALDGLNDPRSGSGLTDFYNQRPGFKDAMSRILMNNFDAVIKSNEAPGQGQAGQDYDGNFNAASRARFEKFFNMALFSPPPGANQEAFKTFLGGKLESLAGAVNSGDMSGFAGLANDGNGFTPREGARLLGNLLGTLNQGYTEAIEKAGNDRDRQIATTKGLLDVVASLIPLPGDKLLSSALLTTLSESIKSFGTEEAARRLVEEGRVTNGDLTTNLFDLLRSMMGNWQADFDGAYGATR